MGMCLNISDATEARDNDPRCQAMNIPTVIIRSV
jgi:hypothetical protein